MSLSIEYNVAMSTVFREAESLPSATHTLRGKLGKLSVVRDVFSVGPYGTLLSADGHLLRESSWDLKNLQENWTYNGEFPTEYQTIPIPTLILNGWWQAMYWHWMTESLPRALIAREHGFKGLILIPKGSAFLRESLVLMGFPDNNIRTYTFPCLFEELWVPEVLHGGAMTQRPELISAYTKALLQDIPAPERSQRRLFLDRKHALNQRTLVNKDEVTSLLKTFDFEVFQAEKHDLRTQLRMYQETNLLFGAHGAGLFNSLFMPKRSTVIEAFSPIYVNMSTLPFVNYRKHIYYPLVSGECAADPTVHGDSVKVNIPFLRTILNNVAGKDD